ncbi:hypothetical protein ACJJTC_017611 [Scirpophaga incertulas]
MFYDKKFMSSQCLNKVWKIAHNSDNSSDEDFNMSNICENLVSWIACDEENPRRRLSLRTSSTMINGTLRLYKRKLKRLYDDIDELDKDIIFRNKIRIFSDSYETSSEVTQSSSEMTQSEVVNTGHFIESQTYTQQLDANQSNPELEVPLSPIIPVRRTLSPLTHNKGVQVSQRHKLTEETDPIEDLPFGYVIIHKNIHCRIPSKLLAVSLDRNVNSL